MNKLHNIMLIENIDVFNKSYKESIIKKDKFWFSLIDHSPIITKILEVPVV